MGLRLSPANALDVLQFAGNVIREGKKAIILHLNIHGAVLALRRPWMFDFYNQASMVVCDGDGVRLGLRLLDQDPPPKIPITRWIWELAAFCEEQKFRLYLLGARKDVIAKAAEHLIETHPRLVIAGYHDGYFPKKGPENDRVISEMNETRPDVLLVCFGMPEQEKWIMRNQEKLNAKVIIPGGAVMDYVAGKLGKAPVWMVRHHLEWLFRIWQEPRRLFRRYATEIPYFLLKVLFYKVGMFFKKR